MRIAYLTLLASLIFLAGCKKCEQKPENVLHGVYEGTFQRIHTENGQVASVQLTFAYPSWSGISSMAKYPALGNGKFALSNGNVNFINENFWTADFDGTLILHGTYQYRREADSLIITRTHDTGWKDIYLLKKK